LEVSYVVDLSKDRIKELCERIQKNIDIVKKCEETLISTDFHINTPILANHFIAAEQNLRTLSLAQEHGLIDDETYMLYENDLNTIANKAANPFRAAVRELREHEALADLQPGAPWFEERKMRERSMQPL